MKKGSLSIVYFKLLMTATFWGGTFIAARAVAQNVGPFSAAFLRFAIASMFLLLFAWKVEAKFSRIGRRQILLILLLGMTGVFSYNYFFFKGMKFMEAGRASVIVASNPVFIALFSTCFFKEKLTPLQMTGILISVAGAIIVVTRGRIPELFQGDIGRGELYLFGCVASWVIYSLIGKLVMNGLSPFLSVTYSVVVGTVALSLPACLEGMTRDILSYSLPEWLSLFYLGFFGTVLGFIWYYQGIQRIGPTKAGLFINFVPISGVLLGFLILGEPITGSLSIGVILVSMGVYLTNRRTKGKGT